MNRKGEHFSPSRTLTLPHAIKLTDRYVGCAPTDSLRHVSIYISYPSLFHQRAGWPAVVLMWTALLIFFSVLSDRQISRTGIFLTVGAFGLHHTIVWLAASVLSGGFAVWWLWLASSIYWPAQTNQLSSHRTVLGRYFFSPQKDACLLCLQMLHWGSFLCSMSHWSLPFRGRCWINKCNYYILSCKSVAFFSCLAWYLDYILPGPLDGTRKASQSDIINSSC